MNQGQAPAAEGKLPQAGGKTNGKVFDFSSTSAPGVQTGRSPVLVTGGAGFLGCNLVDRLAAAGESVIVYDNLSRGRVEENLAWLLKRHPRAVSAIRADVLDRDALSNAVKGAKAVIHLAAQVAVTTSLADPIADFEANARGTLNVLEAVRRHAAEAPVLFASTNKVYGKLIDLDRMALKGERYVPADPGFPAGLDETTPLAFHSPYGCSKGVADQYVLDYARVFGLKTVVFRMSCLYGPHQFGTEDQGWVAHFLITARNGHPITIYGDGYQVRDVLYVDDAVDAYLAAIQNIDAVSGRVFNLGGGPANTVSLRELLALIARETGIEARVEFATWRPGDQPWYVSDTAALERACGWKPRVAVREGLARLDSWLESGRGEAEPARQSAARELSA
ncbi:SDR family NAD(P)-dependent oxidoreductase [Rhizobiales bacterium L72]|uniref:SDR family NAD(P)-dependent oxidoreductase n=2 Tax=Propylenella binzhouense TaxID=2555902 RepID=A0A964WUZ8_9HYPH|nr:SDR family NAD(P)-dependent oxidoreductase [Propylenella binzhouense]